MPLVSKEVKRFPKCQYSPEGLAMARGGSRICRKIDLESTTTTYACERAGFHLPNIRTAIELL
jgi:hypothetical protein